MDTCVETALQLALGIPLVPKIFTAKEIQQSNLKTAEPDRAKEIFGSS